MTAAVFCGLATGAAFCESIIAAVFWEPEGFADADCWSAAPAKESCSSVFVALLGLLILFGTRRGKLSSSWLAFESTIRCVDRQIGHGVSKINTYPDRVMTVLAELDQQLFCVVYTCLFDRLFDVRVVLVRVNVGISERPLSFQSIAVQSLLARMQSHYVGDFERVSHVFQTFLVVHSEANHLILVGRVSTEDKDIGGV